MDQLQEQSLMKTAKEIEKKLVELKPVLMRKYFVDKIGYFGSFSEQGQDENSDLDILVSFSKPVGWAFFTLEKFLEEVFEMKVDLVTEKALKARLKNKILQQVKYIWNRKKETP